MDSSASDSRTSSDPESPDSEEDKLSLQTGVIQQGDLQAPATDVTEMSSQVQAMDTDLEHLSHHVAQRDSVGDDYPMSSSKKRKL